SIGDFAFYECNYIEKLSLPNTLTKIGSHAFYNNKSLEGIDIPNSVAGIGDYAFAFCEKIKSIELSNNVTVIEKDTFMWCSSLVHIRIPAKVTKVESGAFNRTGSNIQCEIIFLNDMPSFAADSFVNCKATIYYPCNNKTWDRVLFNNFGGTLTWTPQHEIKNYSKAVIDKDKKTVSAVCNQCKQNAAITVDWICCPDQWFRIGVNAKKQQTFAVACIDGCDLTYEPGGSSGIYINDDFNGTIYTNIKIPKSGLHKLTVKGSVASNALSYTVFVADHNYKKETIQATCTEYEKNIYTCTICENKKEEKGNAPLGHNFEKYISNNDATCIKNGTETANCTRCGITDTREAKGSALGHKPTPDKNIEPDCTNPGKAGGSHCSVCGAVVTQPTIVPAKGHTLVTDSAVEPTCSTLGKTEGQHCSVCGTVTVEQKDLPMTEHTFVADPEIEPTCSSVGKTAGEHCSVCGIVTVEQEDIPMLSHEEKTEFKAATFASDGKRKTVCSVCGKTINETTIAKIKTAVLLKQKFAYSGKAILPNVLITDQNGKSLKAGTDYTVAYKNNTLPGQASATIIFKGNYSGKKVLNFSILPGATSKLSVKQTANAIAVTWSKVTGATGYKVYLYSGKKLVKTLDSTKTSVTFKKLSSGTNYTVIVKAYTKSGNVILTSAASRKLNTATRPVAPSINVRADNKQAKVSWKKVAGANNYTVYYSLKKNGGFKKLSTAKNSCVIKNLKPGKTYYFKVVANKKAGNKVISSSYSKTVSVTIKK
ncbi:MAG: fibronectin type III domain-containing protein, partial [Clostridia bacterium]|nr:fibronectin type III domain-containing protein [Clostridia bacterium]